MAEKQLDDLFLDTLKDIYFAERQILKALPKMAKAATSEDLKRFHGTNERLSIANYADMIRFYLRFIQSSAG